MGLRRLDMAQIQDFKADKAQCERDLTSSLNDFNKRLISKTKVTPEKQREICDSAENAVNNYEVAVKEGSAQLAKFQQLIDLVKNQQSENIEVINTCSDRVTDTQKSAKELGEQLQSSGAKAEFETNRVLGLKEKSDISADVKNELQAIVARYEETREKGEKVSGAVSDVIQRLLALITKLDTQKRKFQQQAEARNNDSSQPENPPKSTNDVDFNQSDCFDNDSDTIKNGKNGANKSPQQANREKKGTGVTSKAAEILDTNNSNTSKPIAYSGVNNNIQRVPLDFKLTPKLANYVTQGNCYERYTVMSRLTDLLLQKVTEYLNDNGGVLQKIAWDEHDHLYFNNCAFDFNMINDDGGAQQLGLILENDLQGYFNNNEWGKLFIISAKSMRDYCADVGVLDFANVEQYNEFIRVNVKAGFFGLNTTNIAKVCKKLRGRGMLALSSIRLNGLDIAYHDSTYAEILNYDAQILNASTQEEYTMAYNNRARLAMQVPDMNIMNKAGAIRDSLCTGINAGGAKSLISKLWEKPIFRVPCKVFGYAKGVPLAFTALMAMGPFAVVCGLCGLGVLGMHEWTVAKRNMGMDGPVLAQNTNNYVQQVQGKSSNKKGKNTYTVKAVNKPKSKGQKKGKDEQTTD